jgi:hypothetical protein
MGFYYSNDGRYITATCETPMSFLTPKGMRDTKAAIIIQKWWRSTKAAIIIQKWWRSTNKRINDLQMQD